MTSFQSDFDAVRWYAAHTKANQEQEALRQLKLRQVEAFLPLRVIRKRKRDQRVEVKVPLFPGYVFVHIPLRERNRVLTVRNVARIVGSLANPSPIPDCEVAALIESQSQNRYVDPYPDLAVGARVRVVSGPFAGLEGTLLRRKKGANVVITISAISSSFVLGVDIADIERVHSRREDSPSEIKLPAA